MVSAERALVAGVLPKVGRRPGVPLLGHTAVLLREAACLGSLGQQPAQTGEGVVETGVAAEVPVLGPAAA
jgi:hypothetical protein